VVWNAVHLAGRDEGGNCENARRLGINKDASGSFLLGEDTGGGGEVSCALDAAGAC